MGAENKNTGDPEEKESVSKKSGMRGLFRQAKTAASGGIERVQDAATPHMDRAREAATPHVERVQEAVSPHVERATEAATPHVERAQDIYAKTVGAEFRDEFTRYVNAATTTIVGLHQDHATLSNRVVGLEDELRALQRRVNELETR